MNAVVGEGGLQLRVCSIYGGTTRNPATTIFLYFFLSIKKAILNDWNTQCSGVELNEAAFFEPLNEKIKQIKTYIRSYQKHILTRLDEIRIKSMMDVLARMKSNLNMMASMFNTSEIDVSVLKKYFSRLDYDTNILDRFAEESFGVFPNVELWFLCNGSPVGACTITANELIWSSDSEERGNLCGKMLYADVKSLNRSDATDLIRQNIARIKLYLWLGYENEAHNIFENPVSMLYQNADLQEFDIYQNYDYCQLPKEICYKGT